MQCLTQCYRKVLERMPNGSAYKSDLLQSKLNTFYILGITRNASETAFGKTSSIALSLLEKNVKVFPRIVRHESENGQK